VPVPHRGRDRRRVRGHQLGHRRADPGPAPGPGRPDHQRLVLARDHVRGRPVAGPAEQGPVRGRPGLADRLRPGRGARAGHPAGAAQRPREPPLAVHPRPQRAGRELVDEVEGQIEDETGEPLEEVTDSIKIRQRKSIGFGTIAHTAFKLYPKRTVLGLSLFIGQAFLYNAVFFTVFYGYLIGAVLMIAAGIAEWFIGVEAAGKSLEDVARPLTAEEDEGAGATA
jgi:hypothetical protein